MNNRATFLPDVQRSTFNISTAVDDTLDYDTTRETVGSIVTRDTAETITLTFPLEDGRDPLVVPPGIRLFIDIIGLNYDPKVYPDPERFDPSRWYGKHELDLSMFSLGSALASAESLRRQRRFAY
ncbi:hypothetical protein A0H81_12674 [Grifola frondosa]|uniref:Uncharacterized protein n=1 Tax=Grifola frondosa TaxID=5627 RepID=A0A1C7LR86_GRIFR|nr:hypothetical protein A0H81_12674 [Grifola frondosa]